MSPWLNSTPTRRWLSMFFRPPNLTSDTSAFKRSKTDLFGAKNPKPSLREIYWELLTVSTRFTYPKYCIRGKNTVKINYLHLSNEYTFF